MTSLTSLAIGVLITTALFKYLIYPSFISPLSRIPNAHWSSPIHHAWIKWKKRSGLRNRTICSLHQKLGPVVRLGPNELSFNSIEALKIIYTGAFEKHEWHSDKFMNFGVDNLVSFLRNKPHSEQKRILSRVYSKSYLQESVDLQSISSSILSERLLPILDRSANAEKPINVYPLLAAVGMDSISAYLFGTTYGTNFVQNPRDWGHWLGSYEKFKTQSKEARRGGYLESWTLSLCQKVEQGNNEHRKNTKDPVVPSTFSQSKREHGGKTTTDPVVYKKFSQGLEKIQDPRPRDLTIASEILDHLLAGYETSGITVTYLMWQLSQNPKIQASLREELLTLSPTLLFPGPGFTDSSALPPARAIDSLPLLDAVVRETLRLHAAAPGPLPRVTPSSSTPTVIEGYTIPAGVKVSSSAHTLHRNLDVYPQPNKWLPERWLHPDPDKVRDMRRLFWAFGSGGRMCIGSNFALQQIKLVTAAVYTNYITTIHNDDGIEQEDSAIAPPIGRSLIIKFQRVGNGA